MCFLLFPQAFIIFTTPMSSSQEYVIHQGLYFFYHLCLGVQCTMNYDFKKPLNAIPSNFTGKNNHWQPMSKNVASVSDVIIKGDIFLMEMWMLKGYRARVGGMYEDVLVVKSVGPVATKHLISLIKRPLAGSSKNSGTQATCQDCTHLPSLAHRQTRPLARATQATEEKKVLRQILGRISRHFA